MSDPSYSPGSWFAVVGARVVVLLDDSVSPSRLQSVWDACVGDPSLDELIEVVTGGRFVGAPFFGIAMVDGAGLRVVVRTGVTAVVGESIGAARAVVSGHANTWVEEILDVPQSVRLYRDSAPSGALTLPLSGGIVLADEVTWTPSTLIGSTGVAAPMLVSLPGSEPATSSGAGAALLDTSVDPPVLVTPANPVPQAGHDPADSAWDVWALDEAGELGGSGNDDHAEPTHRTLPPAELPVPTAQASYQTQPAHEPRPDYETQSGFEPQPAHQAAPGRAPAPAHQAAPGWEAAPVQQAAPAREASPAREAAPAREILPPPLESSPAREMLPPLESSPARETLLPLEPQPAFETQSVPEPVAVPTMLGLSRAPADAPTDEDELDRAGPPIIGFLRFSTGQVVPLDRSVIVGRSPAVAQYPEGPRSVKIDNEDQDISRNHLEVRLEGGQVTAVDLNSANGTIVTVPGRMPQQLAPHQPFPLVFGAVVELSEDVSFRFEVQT